MSDFFSSTYRPPGVYTAEEPAQTVGNVGIGPTVIAIVGPSIGYMTATEAVTLQGTTNVRLSNKGVDNASVIVTKSNGQVAIITDDYVLTPGAGNDSVPFSGDDVLDIKRGDSSTIGDGETVVVSYRYTDATFYSPRRFSDFNVVKDFYGPPIDSSTGAIVSPLSFAAKMAFDNGASQIVLVATPGTSTAVDKDDLASGYAKLMAFEDISVIVPLTVGINGTTASPGDVLAVGVELRAHINSAFGQGVRRIGFLGYETGVTIAPEELASSIEDKRVSITWPARMGYFNAFLSQSIEVGGYYAAAAEAGALAALPVNTPLTRKQVRGLTIPPSIAQDMSRGNKDLWSKSGVMVLETNSRGSLVVRHGTTTDVSSVLSREISIIRAADTMVTGCTTALEAANLIGSPIVAETPARIKGIISNVLETMVDSDTIVDYSGLTVRQISGDPSVIEVRFAYKPAYPLNYVNIVFGVDPTTGAIIDGVQEA